MLIRKQVGQYQVQKILKQLRSYNGNYAGVSDFVTVQGNYQDDMNQMVLDIDQLEQQQIMYSPNNRLKHSQSQSQQNSFKKQKFQKVHYSSGPDCIQTQIQSNIQFQDQYIKHKFQLQPTQLGQKKKAQRHFLYYDWSRKSKGGLICLDLKAISQQKKVANYILKNLGRKIITNMKDTFNFSLPVNIFRAQTHLQSVCRNLSYAPVVLQKKKYSQDMIQRMKMIVLYMLFMTSSSISVNKPFNPVLGQTLQRWIDGCPVYLQQISHHPPIVSYLMLGRGYKAYGRIGPKTSFGMNSIIGFSNQPNYIQFDNGDIIQLKFGKMIISGVIFGERIFTFQDKIYAIDPKNNLFVSLRIGCQGNMFTKTGDQDQINGKILKIKPQFIQKFNNMGKTLHPQNQDIQQKISNITGHWNQKVFFNGVQYADFTVDNGLQICNPAVYLKSDSIYRKDVAQLLKEDIKKSQQAKQQIEQKQRRDQKLRKLNQARNTPNYD